MATLSGTTRWLLAEVERDSLRLAQEVEYEVVHGPANRNDTKADLARQALILASIQIAGARALLEESDG